MDIGAAIREARKGYFSQKEVAEKTGVTNSFVSLIENNRRGFSLSWLKRFSEVVGLSVPWIMYTSMDSRERIDFIIRYNALMDEQLYQRNGDERPDRLGEDQIHVYPEGDDVFRDSPAEPEV